MVSGQWSLPSAQGYISSVYYIRLLPAAEGRRAATLSLCLCPPSSQCAALGVNRSSRHGASPYPPRGEVSPRGAVSVSGRPSGAARLPHCPLLTAPVSAVFGLFPTVRARPGPLRLSKPPSGAAGGGFDGTERAGTRSDGRKQGRNSADGCGEDRASSRAGERLKSGPGRWCCQPRELHQSRREGGIRVDGYRGRALHSVSSVSVSVSVSVLGRTIRRPFSLFHFVFFELFTNAIAKHLIDF